MAARLLPDGTAALGAPPGRRPEGCGTVRSNRITVPSGRSEPRPVAQREPSQPMYFDEFKHQLPDIDERETADWLESLDQVVGDEGENRARFLMFKLLKRARQLHVGLPPLTQTRYINTISPEQEPFFPGDEELERRIRRLVRWNAVAMVLRANNAVRRDRRPPRDVRLRRQPLRGRLQPLLPGQGRRLRRRPGLLPGPRRAGDVRPGVPRGPAQRGPARPLPARGRAGPGTRARTRIPRLMPDFWEFPTVSMGLGPISAIYQARFNRYLAEPRPDGHLGLAGLGLPRRRRDGRARVARRRCRSRRARASTT